MRLAILFLFAAVILPPQALAQQPFVYEYEEPPSAGPEYSLVQLQPDLDGQRIQRTRLPLLILFSASWCSYCEHLKDTVLIPMARNPDFDQQVLIRELKIDDRRDLTGFDGALTNPNALASDYRVGLVPTLLFVGPDGRELTDRMVGLTPEEYFGGYLDDSIASARQNLLQATPERTRP